MKFLALSPLAAILLAGLTTLALIAMYFLKLRHRRMMIASSMLWSRVLARHEERSFWEKLRRILSILFVVTIGLLMVFAVARPEIAGLTGSTGRTLIVLDSSPSMAARMGDGKTRWQHAVDLANAIVDSSGSGSEFRIADTSGQYDSPYLGSRDQAKQAIRTLRPIASTPQFPESDDSDTQTYFISDGVAIPAVPQSAKKLITYDTARNFGITAFEVRSMVSSPLQYEAYLEVTNFGNDARRTTINITEGGQGHIRREVEIQPRQSYRETFDLSKFDGGGIRATIQTDGDALPTDDIAYTYLPLKKKTKVQLVTKGNAYLQTALKLDSFVDVSTVDPKDYREDSSTDAYVFDDFAPAVQPLKPALIIGAGNGAQSVPWLPRPSGIVEKPSFTTWQEDHPVMKYLSLHDVSIAKASAVAPANGVTVLAASGETPLIVASPASGPGARWILLTFSLQSSDFPVHESFPLFVDNALAWFGRERLALRRTTGIVEVPIVNAQITGPDGKTVASRGYLDRTVFEARDPGLYVATKDGLRQYVAVNLMSRQYSGINHAALNWGTEIKPAARFLKHEVWFYLLFLAVILLGLEWFTYHRRITL
jgi:hypothetical protein